jgi:hypothetical protein
MFPEKGMCGRRPVNLIVRPCIQKVEANVLLNRLTVSRSNMK